MGRTPRARDPNRGPSTSDWKDEQLELIGIKINPRRQENTGLFNHLQIRKVLPASVFPGVTNGGLELLGEELRKIPSLSKSSYLLRYELKQLNLAAFIEFTLSLKRLREVEYDRTQKDEAEWKIRSVTTGTPNHPPIVELQEGLEAIVHRRGYPPWPVVVLGDNEFAPPKPRGIINLKPMENYFPVMFMGSYKREWVRKDKIIAGQPRSFLYEDDPDHRSEMCAKAYEEFDTGFDLDAALVKLGLLPGSEDDDETQVDASTEDEDANMPDSQELPAPLRTPSSSRELTPKEELLPLTVSERSNRLKRKAHDDEKIFKDPHRPENSSSIPPSSPPDVGPSNESYEMTDESYTNKLNKDEEFSQQLLRSFLDLALDYFFQESAVGGFPLDLYRSGISITLKSGNTFYVSRNDGAICPYSTKGGWTSRGAIRHPAIGLECKKALNKKSTMCQVAGELLAMLQQRATLRANDDPDLLEDDELIAVIFLVENVTVTICTMRPTREQLADFRAGIKCNPKIEVEQSKAFSLGDNVERESFLRYVSWIFTALSGSKSWIQKLG